MCTIKVNSEGGVSLGSINTGPWLRPYSTAITDSIMVLSLEQIQCLRERLEEIIGVDWKDPCNDDNEEESNPMGQYMYRITA